MNEFQIYTQRRNLFELTDWNLLC